MRIFLLPILALILALPTFGCSNDDATILPLVFSVTLGTTAAPRNGTISMPAGTYDLTVTTSGDATVTGLTWNVTRGTIADPTSDDTTWTTATTPGKDRLTLEVDGDVNGKAGTDIYVFNVNIT